MRRNVRDCPKVPSARCAAADASRLRRAISDAAWTRTSTVDFYDTACLTRCVPRSSAMKQVRLKLYPFVVHSY